MMNCMHPLSDLPDDDDEADTTDNLNSVHFSAMSLQDHDNSESKPFKVWNVNESKAPIYALPNELLVKILSDLPARQVVKVRQVSKVLKDCIDENEAAIMRPSMTKNQSRVVSQFRHIVDLAGIDIGEAMRRYYQYYGPDPISLIYADPCESFCHNWTVRNYDKLSELAMRKVSFALKSAIEEILQRCCDPYEAVAEQYLAIWSPLEEHEYEKADFKQLVEDMAKVSHIDPVLDMSAAIPYSMPNYLSNIKGDEAYGNHLRRFVKSNGDRESETIEPWLGLPDLGKNCMLRYHVKAQAAWWIVENATRRHGMPTLSTSKRATVLEEIFIW